MSLRLLDGMVGPSSTVMAIAYLNMGIAEMVWAEMITKFNDIDAPLDVAMRNWNQGITAITKGDLTESFAVSNHQNKRKDSQVRALLHARLLGNMAYGTLHMNHHPDYIARSTQYASESLAIYDAKAQAKKGKVTNENADPLLFVEKEGLSRTLSILATCHHLYGDAVTSQGLFQSSLDKVPIDFSTSTARATSLQLLEQGDTYERYSDLCNDWENREGDVQQLQQKVADIHSVMLPEGWKDKSSINGSLWFWTPGMIQR
jgi:hypothetical protein